jgi:hypothetical protein
MPHPQPRALPSRLATALMALLLIIGFYLPTSVAETISIPLKLVSSAILLSILAALLLRKHSILSLFAVINVMAINVILLICTLLSPFTEFAYGGYIPVLLLSALFCVSVRNIGLTAAGRRIFDATNAMNLILAALLLLPVPAVTQFFLSHYAYGYEDLLPYMLEEGKAVLTFGSHSLAAFFFYLLFYMTFQTFVTLGTKLNLFFALGYLALLLSLACFTSLVFAGVAAVQLVSCLQWRKSVVAGLIVATLLLAATAVVGLDRVSGFTEDMLEVSQRQDNGLLGRYSTSGGLLTNLEYIAGHPFSPIGLGMSWQLWYSDSGPVEYLLKGSFPLLFTVYTGAYLFFRKNLRSRRQAVFLFLVFLGFELGFSNLQYLRTQYFLPFVLVYLNGLEEVNERKMTPWPGQARWAHA